MVKDHSNSEKGNLLPPHGKEGNVLFNDALNTFLSTVIWRRNHHMGYSFKLAARVLLYAPSHRPESTYHSLCYTSHETQAGLT